MPYVNSVFLSGRYEDLVEERKGAIEVFVNLGLLPITMEQFCADYHKKLAYIEERICEADYFALIIGSTYGEYLDEENKLSFTEWEYNVAIKHGKKILAFICRNADKPPVKADLDNQKVECLNAFIKKVEETPIVGFFQYGNIASLKFAITNAFRNYGYHGKDPTKYSGVWISDIKKVSSYPHKSDKWTFYGKGSHVFGTIERVCPRSNKRNWSFTGIEFGDQLLVSFAELDAMQASAGIMIVQKIPNMDAVLQGFYYEFSKLDSDGRPLPVPITLRRKKQLEST